MSELAPVLLRRERLLVRTVALLMVLLFITTIGSLSATVLALNARQDTVSRATKRITSLQHDLADARDQIAVLHGQNADASAKLDAVLEQLRQMGATPVVTASSTTTAPAPARRRAASTTTATTTSAPQSPPTPTTTTAPPPSPGYRPPPSAPPADPAPHPTTPIPVPCETVFVPLLCTR